MIRFIKRLFCKHNRLVHLRTDLVKQNDGSWKTCHICKCRDCGKEIG